jgi:glutamate racemase
MGLRERRRTGSQARFVRLRRAMIIGLFDSGVGGLSVLRALRRRLPAAPLLYVADSAWAPYGERDPTEILDRSQRLAEWLIDRGAELIVVACNTATAHAIDALRERRPQQVFIGVEPGIKPAAALTRNGRTGVLATPATLASGRLRARRAVRRRRERAAAALSRPCGRH